MYTKNDLLAFNRETMIGSILLLQILMDKANWIKKLIIVKL